jgi:hypothetical protein
MYKVSQKLKGYTIRKLNWLEIMKKDEYHEISRVVKRNVQEEYNLKIKNKVLLEQSKIIRKLQRRKD